VAQAQPAVAPAAVSPWAEPPHRQDPVPAPAPGPNHGPAPGQQLATRSVAVPAPRAAHPAQALPAIAPLSMLPPPGARPEPPVPSSAVAAIPAHNRPLPSAGYDPAALDRTALDRAALHPAGYDRGPASYDPAIYDPASYAPARYDPARHEPAGYDPGGYTHDPAIPTAEEFARRRIVRPADPVARTGLRGAVSRGSLGLLKLAPGAQEREILRQIETVRRNFGGLRQVTVVNPKGGAGKTVAVLLLAMTFGQRRGGYVLAWDNNETQGTLGMRAQQDFHARTVRDLLRDLDHFSGPHGRVGDLSQYVRAQGEGMFDVLASDESATAGEMLTDAAFADIREVVSRFYKLIMVDTGNNVRAANWQAAIDATDQLVVTMSARNDSAETAARMLDHLEQSGRQRLVRQAVTVVSMPPSRKEIDLPAIRRHFAARTRAVLLAPYERLIDTGEPLRYGLLSGATRQAWLTVAATVAEGL
jgi:MinD-like ATPase involved in chromosome partitioning or flagellar assembly